MDTIRLIENGPASGPANMAADEVLLASTTKSRIPAIRFYRWDGPVLSLGYFQRYADREAHKGSKSCPAVRRHSGGGAIVHDRELTYALVWPHEDGSAGRLDGLANRLYTVIHRGLIRAIAEQGATAQLHESGVPRPRSSEPFLCFQRRASGDVVLGGQKVMGSAQRRKKGAILQHGSLLLARSAAAAKLPGLAELAPNINQDDLICGWKTFIFEALSVRPCVEDFTDLEVSQSSELSRNKFSSDVWTKRR